MPAITSGTEALQRLFDAFISNLTDNAADIFDEQVVVKDDFFGVKLTGREAVLSSLSEAAKNLAGMFSYELFVLGEVSGERQSMVSAILKLSRTDPPEEKRLSISAAFKTDSGEPRITLLHCARAGTEEPSKSKEVYEEALETNVPGGMLGVYWEDGFPVYLINRRMLDYLGYESREQFFSQTGGNFSDYVHPDDLQKVAEIMAQNHRSALPYEMTYRLRRADGSYFWVRDIGIETLAPDGRGAVVCVCNDITAQLETQERVRRQQEQIARQRQALALLFETVPCGIVQYSQEPSFRFLKINRTALNFLGLHSNAEFQSFIKNRFRGPLREEDQRLLSSIRCSRNEKDHRFTVSLWKDGAVHWLRGSVNVISGADGTPIYQCVFLDATAEVEREHQVEDIMEKIPVGITIFGVPADSGDLQDLYMNPYGWLLLGRSEEGFKVKISEAVHPEDYGAVRENIQAAIDGSGIFQHTFRLLRDDGSIKWVRLNAKIVSRKQDGYVFYGAFTDMDEQKQAEAAVERQRSYLSLAMQYANMSCWEYVIKTHTMIPIECTADSVRTDIQTIVHPARHFVESGDINPASVEVFQNMYRSIEAGEPSGSADIKVLREDGRSWANQRIQFATLKNEQGVPERAICIERNIDDLMLLQSSYNAAQERCSALEDGCISAYRVNATKRVCEYSHSVPDAVLIEAGEELSPALTGRISAVVPDENKRRMLLKVTDPDWLLEQYASGNRTHQLEYQRLMPDGELLWLELSILLMPQPETEDVIAFFFTRDISEAKLKSSILDTVVQTTCDFIALTDVVSGVNQRIDTNSCDRYPPETVRHDYSRSVHRFAEQEIPPEDREHFESAMSMDEIIRQLAVADVYRCAFTLIERNGEACRKEWLFRYLDGEKRYFVFVRRNVTPQPQKE